ncbi:hypothetical protein DCS_04125 [Drechmeria coniospora]|uniref:Uncharacterized protein n=1 Tax=Drechmeria coniospora TaxID=98403 RepID=A0A151GJ60_DRECN|nr:hypothetical protein DCS_04125 [Drechmeria coniospora]KYK57118.1 hypothetical protein DCS_04125 [Drechmeria coniospora]ODA79025.1 hypothetical protein RJ55_04615 [Drechmeria coniospora]
MSSKQNVQPQVGDKANGKAGAIYSLVQRSLDQVVKPSVRHRAYDSASTFASSRPILFSFAASQLALSFLPLLLFVFFAASTVAFALGTAIVFALFWISLAFLVLVPALLVTSSIAVFVWAWALGSFLVARWLYNHAPTAVKRDVHANHANGPAKPSIPVKNVAGVGYAQ